MKNPTMNRKNILVERDCKIVMHVIKILKKVPNLST